MARDTVDYKTLTTALSSIFSTSVPPIRACFDFLNRKQGASETASEYLLALRAMIPDCGFGADESRMLAIAFTIGCRHKSTQEKLLSQVNINLDEFMRIATGDESAREHAAAIRGEHPNVHKVHKQYPSRPTLPQSQPRNATQFPSNSNSCSGCGSKTHAYKDSTCPARNASCNFCQAKGHFQKFCRKKRNNQRNQASNRTHVVRVKGLVKPCATVAFKCNVEIRSPTSAFVPIEAEVDSGSDVTAITQSLYYEHFSGFKLTAFSSKISNFDGSTIDQVLGQFESTLRFRDRMCTLPIFVVPDSCSAILGKNAIRSLSLTLDGPTMSVRAVQSSYKSMLSRYPNLTKEGIGVFPDFCHSITVTNDAKPRAVKLRPVPLARRDAVAKEIDFMVKQGIWEKVEKSEWVHQMVIVMKPNGQPRITTDLSPLNQYVIPERYPLPHVKDLFLELSGATIFTKLDLKKGYFHIQLSPESRALTATITPSGLFQYTKLPMGLKDSASVFQRMVALTLSDCPGCICYIDDILVYGSSMEEHDRRLEEVLKRLDGKDFRLNTEKCAFASSQIQFLGHEITSGAIHPHPENIRAIKDASTPKTTKDVKRFLGMLTYYQDFLPNLANHTEPLRRLLRKNARFQWGREQEAAFSNLKEMASGKLSVQIFDPQLTTIVTVDASNVGLGAVLSQVKNGSEVPICFSSQTLTPAQRNYATNEKEALACLWACEKWEKFLLGRHFFLRTDHQPLTFLLKKHWQGRQSAKFGRWIARLDPFDFTLQYRAGTENEVADFLSRHPLQTSSNTIDNDEDSFVVHRIANDGFSIESIRDATSSDSTLSKVVDCVKNQWPKHTKDHELLPYFKVRHNLSIENGCLLREDQRVIVPGRLQNRLLRMSHKGHPGIVRMKRKLRETYWWPNMNADIEKFVKHCQACECSTKSLKPNVLPRISIPPPTSAWTKLAIDIAGPYYTAPIGRRCVVTVIDYYSKFPEVLLTDSTTSAALIKWLEVLFARYGNPEELVTDNGPQFTSHDFAQFLDSRDIRHTRSCVYTPQQNGLVEVFNRYLKHGVEAFTSDHTSWEQGINELLTQFRATAPSPNEKSPAELMFGRSFRLPFEIVRRPQRKSEELSHDSDCENRNLTCRGPYKRGEWVRARRAHVLKGQSPFSQPMKILEVLGNWTYRLSDGQIWNARRLRRHLCADMISNELPSSSFWSVQVFRRSERSTKGKPPSRFSP